MSSPQPTSSATPGSRAVSPPVRSTTTADSLDGEVPPPASRARRAPNFGTDPCRLHLPKRLLRAGQRLLSQFVVEKPLPTVSVVQRLAAWTSALSTNPLVSTRAGGVSYQIDASPHRVSALGSSHSTTLERLLAVHHRPAWIFWVASFIILAYCCSQPLVGLAQPTPSRRPTCESGS
jgi:hypothetical protein